MKIHTRVGIVAAVCAAAIISLARTASHADEAGGRVKLVGSEQQVGDFLKADIADLQKALSAAKPEKKDLKRARVLAVVIGLNAEALGSKGEVAAVREQAGKVLESLAKDDLDGAKEAAKGLTTVKTATGAKQPELVRYLFDDDPAVKDWDRDLTMQLFKTPRAGGMGIEAKLKSWAEKAPIGKDVDLAIPYAQKSAVVAIALQKMTPPKGKAATEWKKYAVDMQTASEEAMAAAAKKDGKAMLAAFGRLDKACTICHEKFKTAP